MKQHVLVTGSNGQLGKTLEELYYNNSIDLDFTFASRQNLDITNSLELEAYFKNIKFEYCINCAAYTNVEQAEKTPNISYKINGEGTKNIAEICKKYNIILIHISTDYVFDGEKESPYITTDTPNPINEYGKSKLKGEQYIQSILDEYFIVRTSWLYSKKYGKNFYRIILDSAKIKKELRVTNEQKGCPTNTESLATFIIDEIIKHKNLSYGLCHFSDKEEMTWFDFAKQILAENNLTNQVTLVEVNNYRTFARRPKNSTII